MTEVKDYVGLLSKIWGELASNEGPVFDRAEILQMSLAILAEISKDRRMEEIAERGKPAGPKATRVVPSPQPPAAGEGAGGPRAPPAEPAWRSEPATDAQLKFLREQKISYLMPLTKGQASDLIDARVRRWKGEPGGR